MEKYVDYADDIEKESSEKQKNMACLFVFSLSWLSLTKKTSKSFRFCSFDKIQVC